MKVSINEKENEKSNTTPMPHKISNFFRAKQRLVLKICGAHIYLMSHKPQCIFTTITFIIYSFKLLKSNKQPNKVVAT